MSEKDNEFFLTCGHGKKINRVRVFGFTDYQHADDGSSCDDLCNKFNLKSAKLANVMASDSPVSIADDNYRASLLLSPAKRKEYLAWVAKLPLDDFLYEIKLLDRFVVLRHGVDNCLYKLGLEAFALFGYQLSVAIEILFPNSDYQLNKYSNVQKTFRYFRNLPYLPYGNKYGNNTFKIDVECYNELLELNKKLDEEARNGVVANVPNKPSAEPGNGFVK